MCESPWFKKAPYGVLVEGGFYYHRIMTVRPSQKEHLRREIRARLRAMGAEVRAAASLQICQTAAHLPAFVKASCVALFAPLPLEPDIHPLIEEAWAEKKRVVLPLMIPHRGTPELDWHEVAHWEEMTLTGPFGLREPDPLRCRRVPLTELGCVFVPGLGFDASGVRLGRGGGFYDYFLERAPATLPRFGLMFDCQEAEALPREAHDQSLPAIITENGLRLLR
jgi:5-formyltetrahydrofolate cyclo-ligase